MISRNRKKLNKALGLAIFIVLVVTLVLSGKTWVISKWFPTEVVSIVWPQPMVTLTATQTFRVAVDTHYNSLNTRVMWSVEDWKQFGEMQYDGTEFVSEVDTTHWDWKRDNQYEVEFTTVSSVGEIIATSSVIVMVGESIPSSLVTTQNISPQKSNTVDVEVPSSQMGAVATAANSITNSTQAQKFYTQWVPGPINNNQQFIFHTEGYAGRQINAFWNAEGGSKNIVYVDATTKTYTTAINIYGWLWKGAGPYPVTFSITDKNTSAVLASEVLELYWKGKPGYSDIEFRSKGAEITVPAVSTTNTTQVTKAPSVPVKSPTVTLSKSPYTVNPIVSNLPISKVPSPVAILGKSDFFVSLKPAVVNTLSKLTDVKQKAALSYLISQPSAVWLNGDSYETDIYIKNIISAANAKNTVPSFVLYNIAQRDCQANSTAGARTMADYKIWINRLGVVFKNSSAVIVLEPDALAMLNCLSETKKQERLEMLRYAVATLTTASPKILLYIDAGHPFWVNAEDMSTRLQSAGIKTARGFSLNVSSFASMDDNLTFGTYLSNLVGGKHYIVDSSRNGNGREQSGQWCNPAGRALGQPGTIYENSGSALDAVLWIKFPGESDGTCNGGPNAGQFWTQYAVDLYNNKK